MIDEFVNNQKSFFLRLVAMNKSIEIYHIVRDNYLVKYRQNGLRKRSFKKEFDTPQEAAKFSIDYLSGEAAYNFEI